MQFILPDTPIKGGDFIDIALPEQLAVNPSPSTQEITDGNNVVVATYEMVNNRDADNRFINASGRLVFTEGFTNTTEKELDLTFNTSSSSKWADKEALLLTAQVNGQPVSSGLTLINHVSTAVNFGTSNRLWQDDSRFEPYEMPHQSEVSVVNREKAMHTTLVYDIHPETQPYARYNVEKIRKEGYNIRFGESRANNTSVNTLINDLGITATVNDAGTQVILDIPNTPAGFGLNGGSIPVSLTTDAIGAQYGNSLTQEQIAAGQKQNLYRASMKVYKTDLDVEPDLTVDPPIIVKTARPYNFITSSGSSTALATVAVGHVNTKGAVIATPTSQTVKVGETFETQPLTDTSYTFKSIEVKHNGLTQKFLDPTYTATIEDANPVLVTYIYALVETSREETQDMGSVKLNYLDKDGNALLEPVIVVDNEVVSTTTTITVTVDGEVVSQSAETVASDARYDVTDYKKETLDIDGKTYVLMPIDWEESGDLSAGTHEFTYVYGLQEIKENVTEKTGQLIVNYLDADGKAIQSPVLAVSDRVIEKTIETITYIDGVEVDRKVETISTPYQYDVSEYLEETLTIDGVVYQLTEVQGQVKGALGAGQPAINLVYQVKPQSPNVPVTPDPKPQEPTTPKPQEPTTPKPQEPTTPETDPTNPTPQKPGEESLENPASTPIPVTSEVKGQALLPNTGEASDFLLFSVASLSILMGLGLVSKKSKDHAQD